MALRDIKKGEEVCHCCKSRHALSIAYTRTESTMACVSLTSRNVRLRTTLTFGARWHPLATADVQLEMLPGLRARRHHL